MGKEEGEGLITCTMAFGGTFECLPSKCETMMIYFGKLVHPAIMVTDLSVDSGQ